VIRQIFAVRNLADLSTLNESIDVKGSSNSFCPVHLISCADPQATKLPDGILTEASPE
jgi:hypothetical protein